MSKVVARLKYYGSLLDARSCRERVLILATLLIVMFFAADQLFFKPLLTVRKEQQGEMTRVKNGIVLLHAEQVEILRQAKVDPDLAIRAQIAQLDQAIGDLDRKFKAKLVDLLAPQEMPKLLRKMLKRQKKLHLVKMENLPSKQVMVELDDEKEVPLGIYQHALDMELEGSYLRLLAYLKSLELLEQQVFWDILSIDTTEYPQAKIHLQIHTLSLTEDWIGV